MRVGYKFFVVAVAVLILGGISLGVQGCGSKASSTTGITFKGASQ